MKKTSFAIILLSSILSAATFADNIHAKVNQGQGDFSALSDTYGVNTIADISYSIRNVACKDPVKMNNITGMLGALNNQVINSDNLDGLKILKLVHDCGDGAPLKRDWVITLSISGAYTRLNYFTVSQNTNSVPNFDYTKNYNLVVNFNSKTSYLEPEVPN